MDVGVAGQTRRAVAVTASAASAVEPKNILMMGGTRFIGLFLARELVKAGHQVQPHSLRILRFQYSKGIRAQL